MSSLASVVMRHVPLASILIGGLLFAASEIIVDHEHPYQRAIRGGDIVFEHQKSSTIPFWLPVWSAVIPVITFWLVELSTRHSNAKVRHLVWALALTLDLIAACLVVGAMTETAKSALGRLRPDFLARCRLDMGSGRCTNPHRHVVSQGRRSFPSGHTSQSFVVSTYLTLYLLWVRYFRREGNAGSDESRSRVSSSSKGVGASLVGELKESLYLLLLLLPTVLACVVAGSRLLDNRHHYSDVLCGAMLGSFIALLFFVRTVRVVQWRFCTERELRAEASLTELSAFPRSPSSEE